MNTLYVYISTHLLTGITLSSWGGHLLPGLADIRDHQHVSRFGGHFEWARLGRYDNIISEILPIRRSDRIFPQCG